MGLDVLSVAVNEAGDPKLLLQRATDTVLDVLPAAEGVMVGLSDEPGITYVCAAGQCTPFVGVHVGLDHGLSGLALRTGKPQLSSDTRSDSRINSDAGRRLSLISLLCAPLIHKSETLGVIAVNASCPNAFDHTDVGLLTRLAEFISVAVGAAREVSAASKKLLALEQPGGISNAPGPSAQANPAGRFVLSVLHPATAATVQTRQRIQMILDDPDAISVVFQPIFDLRSGRMVAVESLTRFQVEPRQPPDVWFSIAHEVGLGNELEMLAIDRALVALEHLPQDVAVSINVGPELAILPQFHRALSRLPAERLIVELTEHSAVDDYALLMSGLQRIRKGGIRLAVDDAGTGYSGLAHILRIAPDFIKLDRELISAIDIDPVRRALATSLISFGKDTGAELLAEGVENSDELEVLRELGIHYAQGYHLARPAPLRSIATAARLPRDR